MRERLPATFTRHAIRRKVLQSSYKWLVAIAFVAGLFMDLMDATIVNVAIPTLSRDFAASTNTLEWVITGYLISLAIWIPASGWIQRSLRLEEDLRLRTPVVHCRFGAVRPRLERRFPDRLSHSSRRRRRHDDSGGHCDAVPRLPSIRTREGFGGDHDAHCDRAGARSGTGRLVGGQRQLALDLLRQPTRRFRYSYLRPVFHSGAQGA